MTALSKPETVGERLRRLRLERNMPQRVLAVPGVTYAYISRIEAGTRNPSVKALRKLSERLGVPVEYLETGHETISWEADAGNYEVVETFFDVLHDNLGRRLRVTVEVLR